MGVALFRKFAIWEIRIWLDFRDRNNMMGSGKKTTWLTWVGIMPVRFGRWMRGDHSFWMRGVLIFIGERGSVDL